MNVLKYLFLLPSNERTFFCLLHLTAYIQNVHATPSLHRLCCLIAFGQPGDKRSKPKKKKDIKMKFADIKLQ